jgi:hypothetical protein
MYPSVGKWNVLSRCPSATKDIWKGDEQKKVFIENAVDINQKNSPKLSFGVNALLVLSFPLFGNPSGAYGFT